MDIKSKKVNAIKDFLLKYTEPKFMYDGMTAKTLAEKLYQNLEDMEITEFENWVNTQENYPTCPF